MIEGYIGRPGAGKSYTLTERAIREARRGRQVFANYVINEPNCWTFAPEDLLDLPPGVIVIDEAHLWFPARMALKLPPSWLAMISQTRKNRWDLLWAAQHETRVDRAVRDVSSWLWLCEAWFAHNGHPVLFRAKCYEPENFRKPKKHTVGSLKFFNQSIASKYDTFERLTIAEHAKSKDDVYAKQSAKDTYKARVT